MAKVSVNSGLTAKIKGFPINIRKIFQHSPNTAYIIDVYSAIAKVKSRNNNMSIKPA